MENDEENIFAGFRKFFEKNLNDRHGVKWFVESFMALFCGLEKLVGKLLRGGGMCVISKEGFSLVRSCYIAVCLVFSQSLGGNFPLLSLSMRSRTACPNTSSVLARRFGLGHQPLTLVGSKNIWRQACRAHACRNKK